MFKQVTYSAFILLCLIAIGFPTIYAQDETTTTLQFENKMEQRTRETKTFMEQRRAQMQQTTMPGQATAEMKLKRDDMKQKVEELKETMEKKRLEARENFQGQRDEFKQELQTIKDERKKTVIENIDTHINELNVQHTQRLEEVLSKVSNILDRLEVKTASMEAEGKDTAEVKKSIASARALIGSSAEAITTQAGKEYVIDISDPAKIREEVQKTVAIFKSDITSVHEKVKAARLAVVAVARQYGQLHKMTQTITPSITITP